jgi:serine/threonine-protein phosphatase 5
MKEPTMLEISIPKGHTLTICGDTHGQFYDVLEIFQRNGYPSETHHYLFNGDFVDRGSWSTEVALLLYAFKLLYPDNVHINRGNHETDDMNKVYGFEGECRSKYNDRVFKMFSETFSALPLASLVGGKYLVLHGGLFSKDGVTLDDIRAIDRHVRRQPASEGLVNEMLWTDPQPNPGRGPSKRGVGLQFGPDITKAFCEANGLEAVIRSHEVRMGGYEVEHDNRLITVFSAPNYWYRFQLREANRSDTTGNLGAWINLESDYRLQFQTFEAVPHPNVRPMAYASNLVGSMM